MSVSGLNWNGLGVPLCKLSATLCRAFISFLPGLKVTCVALGEYLKSGPSHIPPLQKALVMAMIGLCLDWNWLREAALLGLGFHCLLRTGELLNLQYRHVQISESCGIVALVDTKMGRRRNAQEVVAISDPSVLLLFTHPSRCVPRSQPQCQALALSPPAFSCPFCPALSGTAAQWLRVQTILFKKGRGNPLVSFDRAYGEGSFAGTLAQPVCCPVVY